MKGEPNMVLDGLGRHLALFRGLFRWRLRVCPKMEEGQKEEGACLQKISAICQSQLILSK
jgi:hypothetical protein